VGFDLDRDRIVRGVAGGLKHRGQFGEPGHRLVDPFLGDQLAGLVDQGDVVVAFGPVDPAEHCQLKAPPSLAAPVRSGP
jgi:hypothetical protein